MLIDNLTNPCNLNGSVYQSHENYTFLHKLLPLYLHDISLNVLSPKVNLTGKNKHKYRW